MDHFILRAKIISATSVFIMALTIFAPHNLCGITKQWSNAAYAYTGSPLQAARLVELLRIETQLTENINSSITRAKNSLLQRGVPAETVNNVANTLAGEMAAALPELMSEITLIYAEEFNDDELDDLIRFYQSSTGQKFVGARSRLNTKQGSALQKWFAEVRARTFERMEAVT